MPELYALIGLVVASMGNVVTFVANVVMEAAAVDTLPLTCKLLRHTCTGESIESFRTLIGIKL